MATKARTAEDDYSARLRRGVRDALARKGIDLDSSSDLSRASVSAGLNRRFMQQFLDGTVSSPRAVNMRKMLGYLACTEDELLGASKGNTFHSRHKVNIESVPIQVASVRVREYDVRASNPSEEPASMILIQERPVMGERQIPSALLSKRLHPNAEPAIIRITGDSMEPEYPNGSCVLVDADIRVPSPDGIYVLFDGWSHYIKRCQIVPGSSPAMVRLSANNPEYVTMEVALSALRVCGMVVARLDPVTFGEISA